MHPLACNSFLFYCHCICEVVPVHSILCSHSPIHSSFLSLIVKTQVPMVKNHGKFSVYGKFGKVSKWYEWVFGEKPYELTCNAQDTLKNCLIILKTKDPYFFHQSMLPACKSNTYTFTNSTTLVFCTAFTHYIHQQTNPSNLSFQMSNPKPCTDKMVKGSQGLKEKTQPSL